MACPCQILISSGVQAWALATYDQQRTMINPSNTNSHAIGGDPWSIQQTQDWWTHTHSHAHVKNSFDRLISIKLWFYFAYKQNILKLLYSLESAHHEWSPTWIQHMHVMVIKMRVTCKHPYLTVASSNICFSFHNNAYVSLWMGLTWTEHRPGETSAGYGPFGNYVGLTPSDPHPEPIKCYGLGQIWPDLTWPDLTRCIDNPRTLNTKRIGTGPTFSLNRSGAQSTMHEKWEFNLGLTSHYID